MTLAQVLQQTAPVSLLARKAARLGVASLDAQRSLAVARGCRHYPSQAEFLPNDPGLDQLPNDELAILLLSGSQTYDPMAIRCAAQLLRSPEIDPRRLVFLAIREKTQRPLLHIARAGFEHDSDGRSFWKQILDHLGPSDARPEPHLPHWTRFVSLPGYQRGANPSATWLAPNP